MAHHAPGTAILPSRYTTKYSPGWMATTGCTTMAYSHGNTSVGGGMGSALSTTTPMKASGKTVPHTGTVYTMQELLGEMAGWVDAVATTVHSLTPRSRVQSSMVVPGPRRRRRNDPAAHSSGRGNAHDDERKDM
jgi:hypothetical protein